MQTRYCEHLADLEKEGDFCYILEDSKMIIWLPRAGMCSIRIGGEEHPRWLLTGPREKPTLQPSIHVVGVWHGWLRDGVLSEC